MKEFYEIGDGMVVRQEFEFISFDCSSKTSVVEHCDYSKLYKKFYMRDQILSFPRFIKRTLLFLYVRFQKLSIGCSTQTLGLI